MPSVNIDVVELLKIIFKSIKIILATAILPIVFIVKKSYNWYQKSKQIKIANENFDLLSKTQQSILWNLYYSGKQSLTYGSDLQYLASSLYIKKEQVISNKEAIYILNKTTFSYLTKRHIQSAKKNLGNLSAEEEQVLEMFFEKSDGQYIHPFMSSDVYCAILKLENKKILKKDRNIGTYTEKIVLYGTLIKTLEHMKHRKIERTDVTIDLSKVQAMHNSGGGATGGGRIFF